MSMMNTGDILETIEMFTQDNLDVRTVTMGISLLDCIDPDPKKACEKIYNKITTKAADLVPAVEHISAEYGIPIINKRISVTPIAMLLGACPDADPVDFAKALDAAGKKVGVNFVGGYTALVHKGFSAGDRRLIESIPRALAETDIVCSSSWLTLHLEMSTSMIMANMPCRTLWVTSSMLMFSSQQRAATLATTPTVSCPMTVINAFIFLTPIVSGKNPSGASRQPP